jgi:CPA2 family monovalent cation:H+ antiporter-2
LLLGPSGEFAFVGIGLAAALGIVAQPVAAFALAVTALTMALIPLLSYAAKRATLALEPQRKPDPALSIPPTPQQRHAIVVGYGRVGNVVCTMLQHHDVVYTCVDDDPIGVTEARSKGRAVYFGDATNPDFLKTCGLSDASAVIITIRSRTQVDAVVRVVRDMRPDIPIVSRARDGEHARHLYEIGVSDAVPETIEASLHLSEAALVGLGIPTGPVIASIHEQRDVFRHELQDAARAAGLADTRSIRPKRAPR